MISIVIPTRNAGATIGACLDSLVKQECTDFEVLIVDSVSSDSTIDVVRSCTALGHRLKWTSERDLGIYDAMNKATGVAQGEWLLFLGADDVLADPRVIADVAPILDTDKPDLLYGDVILSSTGAREGGASSLDQLLFQKNVCHQAIFYRSTLFKRLGGYDLRYPIWADWEFNIRCFRHPDVVTRWTNRVIAVYNDQDGISRTEDPVFKKELPATILNDMRKATAEIEAMRHKRSHKLGRMLFGWLDR